MEKEKRIVWILGAGFSRSLGAPLLADLFTQESQRRARITYGSRVGNRFDDIQDVGTVCQAGTYGLKHSKPFERQWEHAEEFIEKLDLAARDPHGIERTVFYCFAQEYKRQDATHDEAMEFSSRLDDDNIGNFHLRALRLLAAETCCFLEKANLDHERWAPYLKWARTLSSNDTVITFNYDRVLELLAQRETLWIPAPADIEKRSDYGFPERAPTVLKLHGSVDWVRRNGKIIRAETDPKMKDVKDIAALYCEYDELALATPGPTKREMVQMSGPIKNHGPLAPLWVYAAIAVKAATAVAFVGYRFPPTDAISREKVLEWIDSNTQLKTGMPTIHTVLGADTDSTDSLRLRGMLNAVYAAPSFVKPWPMFAEDFLGLVNRDSL